MYSVVMVVAMAGAPEAPACCPTFHCPKICLPKFHCPTFHMPKLCCKPTCHTTTTCCAPAAPVHVAPAPVMAAPAPVAAPCAPACDTHCAPKSHGCGLFSKCFSCFSICGKHGGGWDGGYATAPVYAGPVGAPGCGQTIIPPQGGVVVPQGTVYPQGTVVVPQGTPTTTPPVKKDMPKTGPTPKTGN